MSIANILEQGEGQYIEFGKKSELRNRLLADLLSRTSFMERVGTGIKRIKDACSRNNNKVEFSFSDSFYVEIHSNGIKDGIKDGIKLTDNQLKIIDLVKTTPSITISELSTKIGISERNVEKNIAQLQKENILSREGSRKSGYWKLI